MTDYDIICYHAAIAQANAMLRKGLITETEFLRFEEKMRRKYNLPENSIFRDYRLIYPGDKR
ncbi:MAG: hypothetical protein IKP40_05785 [Clostridia bacterium]|nr:hypothetical protein [Clostridia bacterium]